MNRGTLIRGSGSISAEMTHYPVQRPFSSTSAFYFGLAVDGAGAVSQVGVGVGPGPIVAAALIPGLMAAGLEGAVPTGWQSMNLLNASMSDCESVKPMPWPARTKYPRMSSAFHLGGLAFLKRIGTAVLASWR